MAISSYKVFLMHKATSSGDYTKLVDIKNFPDLGGTPEKLETTTLSDKVQTNILGIQSMPSFDFTANYDEAKYEEIAALRGKNEYFAIYIGGTETGGVLTPTGENGIFEWQGEADVMLTGKGVNEVLEMTISISASTEIKKKAKSA